MFLFQLNPQETREPKHPPVAISVLTGAVIGLLSGLTGTGGGIFLSPLIIFLLGHQLKVLQVPPHCLF